MSQLQKLWAFRSKPKHKLFLVRCSSTYQIVSFDCPSSFSGLEKSCVCRYLNSMQRTTFVGINNLVLGHTMPLPFPTHQTHRTPPLDSSLNCNPISSVAPLQKYPTPSVSPLCKWNISNIVHIFSGLWNSRYELEELVTLPQLGGSFFLLATLSPTHLRGCLLLVSYFNPSQFLPHSRTVMITLGPLLTLPSSVRRFSTVTPENGFWQKGGQCSGWAGAEGAWREVSL